MKKHLTPLIALCGLSLTPAIALAAQAGAVPQLEKAYAILDAGQAVKAETLLDAAIESRKLAPETLARALLYRALARQKAGKLDAAINDYTAALMVDALDPRTRAKALYNRGLIWRQRGQAGQAMEDYTSALYLDPQLSEAYFARAGLLMAAGQRVFALADYDKALKYDFGQPHLVHYARALIFIKRGERGAAKQALYAALKARPDYAPARRRLAALLNVRKGVRLAAMNRRATPGVVRKAPRAATLKVAAVTLRKTPQAAPVAPPQPAAPTLARKKERPHAVRPVHVAAAQPARARAEVAQARRPLKKPARPAAGVDAPQITPVSAPATQTNIKAAAPAGKKPQWTGWAVQIASQRSEGAAWNHWKKVQQRVKRVIRKPHAIVEKAEIAGRGTFYRLRLVGYADRKKALKACRGLKRRGTSCLVIRAGA